MTLKDEVYSPENRVNNTVIALYGNRWQLDSLGCSFYNVFKCWITVLYTWNEHKIIINSVSIFKKKGSREWLDSIGAKGVRWEGPSKQVDPGDRHHRSRLTEMFSTTLLNSGRNICIAGCEHPVHAMQGGSRSCFWSRTTEARGDS